MAGIRNVLNPALHKAHHQINWHSSAVGLCFPLCISWFSPFPCPPQETGAGGCDPEGWQCLAATPQEGQPQAGHLQSHQQTIRGWPGWGQAWHQELLLPCPGGAGEPLQGPQGHLQQRLGDTGQHREWLCHQRHLRALRGPCGQEQGVHLGGQRDLWILRKWTPKKPPLEFGFWVSTRVYLASLCTCLIMVCVVFVLVVHCPLILLFSGRIGVFKDPNWKECTDLALHQAPCAPGMVCWYPRFLFVPKICLGTEGQSKIFIYL